MMYIFGNYPFGCASSKFWSTDARDVGIFTFTLTFCKRRVITDEDGKMAGLVSSTHCLQYLNTELVLATDSKVE